MANEPHDTSKEFLLMEYQQIAAAHFQDQKTKIDLYRYYVTLVTVPISLIAAGIGLRGSAIELSITSLQAIGIVIIIISIAAFFLMNMIIDVRFEALMYARTMNLIRKWFYDYDKGLQGYLGLPVTDEKPKFYGGRSDVAWSVGLPTLMDSLLLGLGIWFLSQYVLFAETGFVAYGLIHPIFYVRRAKQRDLNWIPVTSQNKPGLNIK